MQNNRYMKFDDALLFSTPAVDRVADLLRLAGGFANKADDRARFDFQLHFNNNVFRVEVKCEDNYAHDGRGNICMETRQGRTLRRSGIAWSESQVCVHTFGEYVAIYRRREMLEHLRELFNNGLAESAFGDNNNRGYVLPVAELWGFDWFDWRTMASLADSPIWKF